MHKYSSQSTKSIRSLLAGLILAGLTGAGLQYAILSAKAVLQKMETINKQVDVKLSAMNSQPDSAYFSLYREKAWLETRFQIARTDSISLSVNLKDSLLQLELKGVVLKTTKIMDFEADQFFYQLSPGAYHHLFSTQTQAGSDFSTIEKEPITIKKAPKDSTEVAAPANTEPDSLKREAVHWMMTMDNDVLLKIEGINPEQQKGKWAGHWFWFWQDLRKIKQDLNQTIRFKTPEYQPEIRLTISDTDAKAIYRALPKHPLICIRF